MCASLLGLFVLQGVAACGSRSGMLVGDRSELDPAAGSGGSGGSGGSPSSGGTGANPPDGAAGSGAPGCTKLVRREPIVKLDPVVGEVDWRSDLTVSSDDGERVTLLSLRGGSPPPSAGSTLVMASFEPWQLWPADGVLAPTLPAHSEVAWGDPFVLSAAPGDRFSLLGRLAYGSLAFVPGIAPSGGLPPYGAASGEYPLFVSGAPWAFLLGTIPMSNELLVTLAQEQEAGFSAAVGVFACADDSTPSADAEPYDDGFLLGVSHGTNNVLPGCDTSAAAGIARRISVFRVTPNWENEVASFEVDGVVVKLKTAPHPDGLWLVWRVLDRLHWARVEATSGAVIGSLPLSQPGTIPDDFAVTALGRKLAVAWTRPGSVGGRTLELVVLDELGNGVASMTMDRPNIDTLGVVASPDGDSLVVTWVEFTGPAQLMRIDCAE